MIDWKTERRYGGKLVENRTQAIMGRMLLADLVDTIMRPVSYYAVCRRQGNEINTYGQRSMLHFVRFKDDRYLNAVKAFGRPDFVHRHWDARAVAEVMPGDRVVFAEGDEHQPVTPFSYDDSAFF